VTGTKPSAIPDKNGAGIDFMEDDTQWMDDLPDLGLSLPELDPFHLNTLMEDDLPELDSSLP
jgi:hypothetical protein